MIIFLNDLPAKFLRNKHEAIFDSPAHILRSRLSARHIPGRAGSEGPEWLYRTVRSIRASSPEIILIHESYDHWAALHTVREGVGAYDDETYAFECLYPEAALLAGQTDSNKRRQLQSIFESRRTARLNGDMGFPTDATSASVAAGFIQDVLYERIELTPYQADWPQRFEREKQTIFDALNAYRTGGNVAEQSHAAETLRSLIDTMEIYHTGSTAVPDMSAKNIIDMLLVVPDLNHFRALIAPLRACDYFFLDYPQNTQRKFFRKGIPRAFHLHIVAQNSPEFFAQLTFRDQLRADRQLAQEYMELKRRSCETHARNRSAYGADKSEFIRRVLAASND